LIKVDFARRANTIANFVLSNYPWLIHVIFRAKPSLIDNNFRADNFSSGLWPRGHGGLHKITLIAKTTRLTKYRAVGKFFLTAAFFLRDGLVLLSSNSTARLDFRLAIINLTRSNTETRINKIAIQNTGVRIDSAMKLNFMAPITPKTPAVKSQLLKEPIGKFEFSDARKIICMFFSVMSQRFHAKPTYP
jgi:hypothetical protein